MNTTVKAHSRGRKGSGKKSFVKGHARNTGGKTISGINPMAKGAQPTGSNKAAVPTGKSLAGKDNYSRGKKVSGSNKSSAKSGKTVPGKPCA